MHPPDNEMKRTDDMNWQRSFAEDGTAARALRTGRRRHLTVALAASVLLGLAACGGDTTADGPADGDEDTVETGPEAPVPFGESAEILGWDVKLTAVELDTTELIMTGVIDSEPDPGHQFAKVVYEGTYRGDDAENSFYSDLNVVFWIDGVEYKDCRGNAPEEFHYASGVAVGDTVTSAVCAQIPVGKEDDVLVNIKDWRPIGQEGTFFAIE